MAAKITLDQYTHLKYETDGYIKSDNATTEKKHTYSKNMLILPAKFEVISSGKVEKDVFDNRMYLVSMIFGRIRYYSFKENSLIYGNICQLYNIHLLMVQLNFKHKYLINFINV